MVLSVQFSVLRAEYFYFRRIYCIVKREAVSGIILPADVRADTCAAAHPAGIYGCSGRVAGSTDSRTAYSGCGAHFSLSEQREVSLCLITVFLRRNTDYFKKLEKVRHHIKINRICNGGET